MSKVLQVKLKKIGNSQAVIIPSSFLKGVNNTSEIIMKIEGNHIQLTFENSKSLEDLIKEKRERNRANIKQTMKEIESIDKNKYTNDYVIHCADDLID